MFELPQSEDERIKCFISNTVCFADEGKSYIYSSSGSRRTGRATKYHVHIKNVGHFSVTALSDVEAVSKANKRLGKINVRMHR